MYGDEYMTSFFPCVRYRPRTLSRTWSSLVRSEMRPGDLPWRLGMCHVPGQEKEALGRDVGGCGAAHHCSCLSEKSDILSCYHPVFSSDSVLRLHFHHRLWQLKVFVNQKKAVDVLSKWPPKDSGTGIIRDPDVVDIDFSSQVLRQQRLSRLLDPRWKEPGPGNAWSILKHSGLMHWDLR